MPPSHLSMRHAGAPYSIYTALRATFNEARPTPTAAHRRAFHDYFVTHLPSSSLAPDRGTPAHHKLPRSDSKPHHGHGDAAGPAPRSPLLPSTTRDTTVVRIPLKSAKHHFGACISRGSRPYNEDTFQAGTVEIPAFAQRKPVSISRRGEYNIQSVGSTRDTGDPQVFYFGVFDGHGGSECSEFLRDRLHAYIEESALLFSMHSTLRPQEGYDDGGQVMGEGDPEDLQIALVELWGETVGGYFKRFQPEHFKALAEKDLDPSERTASHDSIETVLTYAFLKADLDFTKAQAAKHTADAKEKKGSRKTPISDHVLDDKPLNENDMLFHPEREASQNLSRKRPASRGSSPDLDAPIGGSTRFKGGSTASVALLSTPSPTPFWHPNSPSTLVVAHVGDTRILLCRTSDGAAVPLTSNHHPSLPAEQSRMRRYATSFVTDSFGEERVLGLANTRAFGDIGSKRVGVSAEPEVTTIQLQPAGYAFMVLTSDGVCGHLEDQEIVDIVKEARTPDKAAQDLVSFAVETAGDADNATALVVRLGGWERRSEGGGGSIGTKEARDFKRQEANDPRSRRQ